MFVWPRVNRMNLKDVGNINLNKPDPNTCLMHSISIIIGFGLIINKGGIISMN